MSVRRHLHNAVRTPFAAALALLAVIAGLRGIIEPETLPLAEVLGAAVGYVWAVAYGAGGLLMLYGMATVKTKFEAAGVVLFGGGAFVQAFATMFFLGRAPQLTLWGVATLLIFVVAAAIRATHLIRGEVLVWLVGTTNNRKDKS